MRNGFLSERPMWEPPTSESEFLFWPSARGEDSESCGNHPRNGAAHSGDSLTGVARNWPTVYGQGAGNSGPDGNEFSTMAREWQTPAADSFRSRGLDRRNEMGLDQQARFWPTPQVHDLENPKTPEQIQKMREDGAGCRNLNETADQWQTPSSADERRSGNYGRGEGNPTFSQQAKNWPTAGANDHKGSAKEGQRRRQLDEAAVHLFSPPAPPIPSGETFSAEAHISAPRLPLAVSVSGGTTRTDLSSRKRLNPCFAAWLMGMPWWWTNPAPISFARSEMESWRCRLRSRLESLLADSVNE
jgi:hypothetical protein